MDNQTPSAHGFRQEMKLIVRRGRQVWRLVNARHKAALGGAALLMAVTSAANTAAIPLLLGRLVAEAAHDQAERRDGRKADALFRPRRCFTSS